jgi:hypothetical protein
MKHEHDTVSLWNSFVRWGGTPHPSDVLSWTNFTSSALVRSVSRAETGYTVTRPLPLPRLVSPRRPTRTDATLPD